MAATTPRWTAHADLAIVRKPVVGRSEYLDFMTFRRNVRPLFTEIFGPIIGLKEEWLAQGATPAELDFSAFRYRCESRAAIRVHTGRLGGLPEVVLEDTAEQKIWRDALGRTMKLCRRSATLPLPQDFPVRTMDDWLKIKPLYVYSEERVAGDWEARARQALAEDRVLCVGMPGGFDEPRQLMGEERLCMAFYDQPELILDMLRTFAETVRRVLDRVLARVPVDVLSVHEDLAGKSGPLIGPSLVREFMVPYYRRVWEPLRERGARLFEQDSDGDVTPVIDAFLEAGLNCMYPMEPTGRMDPVKIRQHYGSRLAFCGGIDKHVLRKDKDAIVRELEYKIPPLIRSGGYVVALDHRIPNGTPLENYRFYVNKVWEILDRGC
jgi:uroporphyrinogen-III decarboxylase